MDIKKEILSIVATKIIKVISGSKIKVKMKFVQLSLREKYKTVAMQ